VWEKGVKGMTSRIGHGMEKPTQVGDTYLVLL